MNLTKFREDFARGTVRIQLLGDSIMNADTVPFEQRWHQNLQASFQAWGIDTQVWTGGAINGSKTEDYVPGGRYSQHVEFCSHQPSLILMDWRINDWWGQMDLDDYAQNYRLIIKRVRELSPDSTIVLINTPWVYNSEVQQGKPIAQQDYAAWIQSVASEFDLPVIELEWFFPGNDPCGFYTPDKVHHSLAGQYVVYTAIRSHLLGYLEN